VKADDERYRRFVVKPLVDIFDPWDIFLENVPQGTDDQRTAVHGTRTGSMQGRGLAPAVVEGAQFVVTNVRF
jgi:hypothetical protein